MFLTQKHLSRRALLKGVGVTVALPWLDAMVPAGRTSGAFSRPQVRLACVEMVHGAAGSARIGIERNLWAPSADGRAFDLRPGSLRPLEPFRDALTIISNTDVANAEPFEAREIGGDHFRSSAVFLTQAHPKRTQGADIEAGTSFDQFYAKRFGQDTPIPSLQLCIENVDQAGGCGYGYSCVYTDAISWAAPNRPLPMIRDPRVAFDVLFGAFRPGESPDTRQARLADDRSILDWLTTVIARMQRELGAADRVRFSEYLESVREIERRIQNTERMNSSGEPRDLPGAPAGVPDSFSDHVKLMFDLQVVAFASGITRVVAFKLARDNSNRVYPESGFKGAFHPASHHGGREARILDFATINTYHVSLIAYFLERLKNTPDGDSTLLDNTLLIYGSPMGDSNLHNHKKVPFFAAGHAGGALRGGVHIRAADQTPLANALLALLQKLGLDDMTQFGDSTGALALE